MKKLLFLLIFFISLQTSAQVNCNLTLLVDDINFTWDGSSKVVTGNISLRRGNRRPSCRLFKIGFSQGLAGNYNRRMFNGSNYLEYNIYKNSSTNSELKAFADFSNNFNDHIYVFFPNNQSTVVTTFEARLPNPNDGRSFIKKGSYIDNITATATSIFGSSLSSSDNFNVSVFVPTEIDISLVNTGASFNKNATTYSMDFGTLEQGEIKSVDLKVRSNAGYNVELSSVNGGALKHLTVSDNINYQMKVNGNTQTFPGANSPLSIGSASGVTNEDGTNFTLSFQIGDPENKASGQYQDTITITATSID